MNTDFQKIIDSIAMEALFQLLPNVYNITGIIEGSMPQNQTRLSIEIDLSLYKRTCNWENFVQKILKPTMTKFKKQLLKLEKEYLSYIPDLPRDEICAYAVLDNLVLRSVYSSEVVLPICSNSEYKDLLIIDMFLVEK